MEETSSRDPHRHNKPKLGDALRAADLGMRFVVTTVLFAGVGFWVDRKAGCAFPIFTLLGLFLGLGAGMVLLIRGLGKSGDRSATRSSDDHIRG